MYMYGISIHALLAESDHYDNYNLHCVEISIHALLAESDVYSMLYNTSSLLFLSTLSLRRATTATADPLMCNLYFYPRSPCGERQKRGRVIKHTIQFLSTLSLRRATLIRMLNSPHSQFLSTLSLRRATQYAYKGV